MKSKQYYSYNTFTNLLRSAGSHNNSESQSAIKNLQELGALDSLNDESRKMIMENGAREWLEIYVKIGGKLNNQDFISALYNKRYEMAKYIIETFPKDIDVNYIEPVNKSSTLHFVASDPQCSVKYLKFFVSKGANVHAKDSGGNTPLYRADSIEKINYLIFEAAADINTLNDLGRTQLHRWAEAMFENSRYHGYEPVDGKLITAKVARIEKIKLYVSLGVDIGAIDANGKSALQCSKDPSVIDYFKGILIEYYNQFKEIFNGIDYLADITFLYYACKEDFAAINSSVEHLRQANKFYLRGSTEEAIFYFDKALSETPNDKSINNVKREALLSLGKIDEAIQSFQKAIAIDPIWGEPYINLGNAYIAKGSALLAPHPIEIMEGEASLLGQDEVILHS